MSRIRGRFSIARNAPVEVGFVIERSLEHVQAERFDAQTRKSSEVRQKPEPADLNIILLTARP